MLIRTALLSALLLAGPFSRCRGDDPPLIVPPPQFLDAGPRYDSRPHDDLLSPDVTPPDLHPHADRWVDSSGRACTPGGSQCAPGQTCALITSKTVGVCATKCDPTKYPLVPNGCPPKTQCGTLPGAASTTEGRCFATCSLAPGKNDCEAGIACHSGEQVGLYGAGVCVGPPGCAKDTDCPVRTATACDPSGTNKCPAGAFCHPSSGGTVKGRCARAGKCDKVSGLCVGHSLGNATAKVGDPCADDTGCGGEMVCMTQTDDGKQVRYRNGYCAVRGCAHSGWTARACPKGSACNRVYAAGLCQRTCDLDMASGCRGEAKDYYGDYECRAWDNLSMANKKVSSGPVCDFGLAMSCDTLASSKLGCPAVGVPKTNKTNMLCRALDGTKLTAGNPAGFCLDDTTSGSKKR